MLTACDAVTGLTEQPEPIAAPGSKQDAIQPVSSGAIDRLSPEGVMQSFIEAWNAQDYETMYNHLSQQSKAIYPYDVFRNRYEVARSTINLTGIEYEISDTTTQGTTAAIDYAASLLSGGFGRIEDPNRVMRLQNTGAGWEIAWTPQDILRGLASDVRLTVQTVTDDRGDILDRNGLPIVKENDSIVMLLTSKDSMPNVEECLDVLTRVTKMPRQRLVALFQKYVGETIFQVAELDSETYFLNREDLESFCAITEDESSIQSVRRRTGRNYYGHGAAAHITGYVGRVPADQINYWQGQGYSETDLVGVTGIERAYQEELGGIPERVLRLVEPGGYVIRELGVSTPAETQDVTLTIDRELQMIVADALADAFNYAGINWGSRARGLAAVAMDVNTGEILAMASYPTFDPGRFDPNTSYDSAELATIFSESRIPIQNKVMEEQYFPGSIFKIITTAATSNEGIWEADAIFECEHEWFGQERFGDALEVRYDWTYTDELDPTGPINLAGALTSSCDPFFYEMGALMFQKDPALLANYAKLFGMGSATGLESGVYNEAQGSITTPPSIGDAINNAIGQGDTKVTPLQMVSAVAAVANGGTLYKPYIVKQIGDNPPIEPTVVRELDISDEALAITRQGMCDVTENEDLGTAFYPFEEAPYTVCGKTGTAEAGEAGAHAWFVSFAPKDDPQIALVVLAVNGSREGSEIAAPITRRILDNYYQVEEYPFPEWWSETFVPLRIPGEGAPAGG